MAVRSRQHPRKPVRLRVSHESVTSLREDVTGDVSLGGVFVATQRPLPLGTKVWLDIEVPGENKPLGVYGEVAWTQSDNEGLLGGKQGMGVKFVDVKDDILKKLQALVGGK